jgi:DNA-directed RNA polymerase specialized sigma24 family protein
LASFDDLFQWLGPDAGVQYEIIRSGLIKIFISKGFSDAEDLADETIDRVIKKLPEIIDIYQGEKARYFHGVARNIIFEVGRRKEIATDKFPEQWTPDTRTTNKYDCLIKCLDLLPYSRRELILDYYLYEGRDKIEHHREMARQLGITVGALRTRARHTRKHLGDCVEKCDQNSDEKRNVVRETFLKRRHAEGDQEEHQPSPTRMKNN